VEGTDQVPVTGAGQSGQAKAVGRITFTNRSREEITISAGTVISTPEGVQFVTEGVAQLAPAVGAWGKTDIRAVEAGPRGNVPRGRISLIGGPLAQKVAVFNEEATASGAPGDMGSVTEGDRKRLRDQLYDRLSKEALAKLSAAVQDGETMLPQVVKVDVLDESYDRRVGEQARALNLRMEVRVSGTAFEQADVDNLAQRAWQPKTPTGFAIVPDSVRFLPPEVVRAEGEEIVLRVHVDGVAAAQISEERALAAVRWRPVPAAMAELERTFILAEPPRVTIDPGWAKRAFRVSVAIRNQ
jgi:hypothetical protein